MTEHINPIDNFKDFEPVINFFGQQLSAPEFSDGDVRVEFYAVSKGLDPEIQDALMRTLEQKRPHVAQFIREELDQI